MTDKWRNYTTPSLVIGTLLSIVSGLVLFLAGVTEFSDSLVIGLVGVTLSIDIDLLDRNEFSSVFMNNSQVRDRIRAVGRLTVEIVVDPILGLHVERRDSPLRNADPLGWWMPARPG